MLKVNEMINTIILLIITIRSNKYIVNHIQRVKIVINDNIIEQVTTLYNYWYFVMATYFRLALDHHQANFIKE